MAFRLFAPPISVLGAAAGLGYLSHGGNRPSSLFATYRCEAPSSAFGGFGLPWGTSRKPMAPPPRNRNGYNPAIYRQISTGSFVGMGLGLCVSRFGKTLCLILGALMLIVETLARQGIDLVPAGKLRRWAEEVDVRGLIMKNTAFKVSFGTAFILASIYG